jgi:hypothetical protein
MGKPFKDTRVGKFLLEKLPNLAGDILPDKGVLGIVKNLIDSDDSLTAEERKSLLKELYELEIADRNSARQREVEVKKAGGQDWMMFVTGSSRSCFFYVYDLCGGIYSFCFRE